MTSKAFLRLEAKARLASIEVDDRTRFGEQIADRVRSLTEVHAARTVLLYADLPQEVPTSGILRQARALGLDVVFPRCLPETRDLSLHIVTSDAELSTIGRYGIREPALNCPTTDISQIDIAFIPGLAWDRRGNRLGRGAGYYDRLLASPKWRAFRCGLFFSAQEFPEIPTDGWDVPLDAVVTERETWRARG